MLQAAVVAYRPAEVSRWVNANGKISLAAFSYAAGATYSGEPVEVVVKRGLGGHPARAVQTPR
jgi:hypothetical protein